MYRTAGELGLPVGHMPFKGFLRHVDEIEQLLRNYPATKCILDHLGFCSAADPGSEEWQRLLALAAYPQVRHGGADIGLSLAPQWPVARWKWV